jgi:hypothetical protein
MSLSSDGRRLAVSLLAMIGALAVFSFGQDPGSTGVAVTTWQNDSHRTGRNLNEGTLVSSNLSTFGQLCSVTNLDGQVYAQPLVETSVKITPTYYPGPVVYVAHKTTRSMRSTERPPRGVRRAR